MKIFVNRKIKLLFYKMILSILIFAILSILFIILEIVNTALYIMLLAFCMSIVILILCYRYFIDQNKILEDAIAQITEYISGNRDVRIECDEEGELCRLFHEVNSLASILNTSAENERKSKEFLKNTISDISHQLKTPLAALNIYNGLLQEEKENSSEIKEFVELSEKELDRIEKLVKNLLKITKLDTGSIVFEKTNENISEIMKEIELHFAYQAKKEEKELILNGDNNTMLFCDRDWMIEAVENIVKNAFDHTYSGDFIKIQWQESASMVRLMIEDNGSGIHPEDLHHIFKRFYRSRFSKDTQGIGLGLPLAKAVIEEHNGTIEVNSKLGEGTTFVINFLIPTKL